MAEILFLSDIHIHAHKGKQERLQNCLDAFYWALNTARERKIHDVVFGGDLFQDRQKISVYTYHQTYKIIEQFSDLHLWLLLGNHDLWYSEKADISSVVPIGALGHVTVIDTPSTHNVAGLDIDFLPYTKNPVAVITENFLKKSPVLVGHVAIDGAVLNFHHCTKAEVSVEHENDVVKIGKEVFDGYKRVFLGHYHGAQQLDEVVEYIGSTLQLTFNEAFQKKHVIVLNTETLDKEYIENTISPKHFILSLEELADFDVGNNFVRVDYDADASQIDVSEIRTKILEKYPEGHVTFVQHSNSQSKTDSDSAQKFDLTAGDTLERYISAVGYGALDQKRLLCLGKDICLEN